MTFDVDANGILNVKAKDKTTGKEQSIRIEASSGLSDADIEKMKKDAEVNAADDAKKKEAADVRNTAEQLVYTAEKALRDAGDKVSADIKKAIENKIADVKKVKDGADIEAIKTATNALSMEIQKIGEALQNAQKATSQQASGPEPKGEGAGEEKVRDADFKEGDEPKDQNQK